jgi:hypothetical protein
LARRSVDHGKLKQVCKEFQTSQKPRDFLQPFWVSAGIAGDPDFPIFCGNFIDLQNARHAADYDFSAPVSRFDALDACDKANQAMLAWRTLQKHKPDAISLFALAVFLGPGLSRR